MSSLLFAEANRLSTGAASGAHEKLAASFRSEVDTLPTVPSEVFTSVNATVAVRFFTLLLARAVQHRLAPTPETLDLCRDVQRAACDIDVKPNFDDMFVSYLVLGLIAYLDLMEDDIADSERADILVKIAECRDWMCKARMTRPFGTRETEGTYAWNHSVVSAAAIVLSVIWSAPETGGYSEAHQHDIDFGLRRIEEFFIHGIRDGGVPYEGFFYFGVVMRALGVFDILVQRDPEANARYQRIRSRHRERLGQLLDWYGSCIVPHNRMLISFNHSSYLPAPALAGMLSFFRDEENQKASRIWAALLWHPETGLNRRNHDLPSFVAHEAMLFLDPAALEEPSYEAQTLISQNEGYALFAATGGQGKLFLKSSKLLYGPHNQADAGHFTWICDRRAVLVDAGPGTKVRDSSRKWPTYSKGTYRTEGSDASSYGHNSILIDGKGERPSGDGDGVDGRITYVKEQAGFWCAGSDAKAAYNQGDYNPVDCADRHIAV